LAIPKKSAEKRAGTPSVGRRAGGVAVLVCIAAAAFLAVKLLGVGAGAGGNGTRGTTHRGTLFGTYTPNAPHVLSNLAVYRGAESKPQPDDLLVAPAAFAAPVARYRAYALRQLDGMSRPLAELQSALAANDRDAAQNAWRAAYASYLRVGAVYLDGETASLKEVAMLNQQIDGNAGGLQGGATSPRFTGLHRIEAGLWTGAAPRSLLGLALRLQLAVRRLRGRLAGVPIAPLEYATRAHEILEDAVRDLLSGADVPWSQEGVLATDAGLQATEEVISTLRPLIPYDEHIIDDAEVELGRVRAAMAAIAAAHGRRLPSNRALSKQQSELLDGSVGGALEALAQVPGALETERPPRIPQIPKRDFELEP
jgi:iron uptake system EfeUOB component EfeO/EfeM